MGGNATRRVGGLAITGLVIAALVGVTSMSASGGTAPEALGPVLTDYGTLTIGLNNATGQYKVVLDPAAAGPNVQQVIGATQPCATLTPGVGTLLTFTPNQGSLSDTVQIRNDAFGVNTGNTSCGSSAAAVISGSERLKIDLGSALTGVFAKSAALNLTRVKSGNLTLGFNGGLQGASIPFSGTVNVTPAQITTADDLFTSITIGSTSTKAGEGLSVANGTSFALVTADPNFEVAVDCGEQVTQLGGEGDIATSAVFFRGENGDKFADACVDVGAVVEVEKAGVSGATEDRVFWNNSTVGVNGSPQDVAGTVTIEWAPIPVEDSALLDRTIDYDADGPAGYTDVLWCESFSSTPGQIAGEVIFEAVRPTIDLPNSDPGSNLADGSNADGTAPWCLVNNLEVLNGDGTITQTQVYFGSGDPWAR